MYLKFTINRQELLTCAKRAAAVVPTISPLDILKCTLIEADAERKLLSLTGTNLEVTLRQTIHLPDYEGEDGSVALEAKLLVAMLTLLGGETVTVSYDGGSQITVSSEDAEYRVPVMNSKDYPHTDLPFPEDTIKVSGVPTMVQRSIFATAERSEMPLLGCVNLKFTSDGLVAVGSDGNCMVSAKGDKQSVGSISFLVPASSLERLARLCDNKDVFQVGTTGKHIVFLREDFIFSARLMQGRYPDTEKITGALSNTFTVLTDAMELRNMLSSVSSVATDGRVLLTFAGDKLRMDCTGKVGNASMTLGVIPLFGCPSGCYAYKTTQLEHSLRALAGTVTLGIAQGGTLTLSTEDAFYMQTPLRLKTAAKAA